jgi:cation diffusion facilitator CzcD-associated flavoprotein CzcO
VLPEKLAGNLIRFSLAVGTQGWYKLSKARPEMMKKVLRKGVERQLPKGFDVDTHFTPSYNPWDQRVCMVPRGDLFKAIKAGKASVVTDKIATFTEKGLLLESGAELEADVIVTATGLDLLFIGGIDITVDDEKVDPATCLSYKGMMLEGVPNFANSLGYSNASWTLRADLIFEYVTRVLNHLRNTGLRQATPVNSDPDVEAAPLLALTSGYITRAADRMPKQGSKFPWLVPQSWLADRKAMRGSPLQDDAMVFSNPEPAVMAAAS